MGEHVPRVDSCRFQQWSDRLRVPSEPGQARPQREMGREGCRQGCRRPLERLDRLPVPVTEMQRHSQIDLQRRFVWILACQVGIDICGFTEFLLGHGLAGGSYQSVRVDLGSGGDRRRSQENGDRHGLAGAQKAESVESRNQLRGQSSMLAQ